jgi:zinc protease
MSRRILPLFLLFIAITSTAMANVTEYTLKNGLKIIVKPDHRAPVAIFQIWYRVGGSYEPNGITGISHALEHMMFEGSRLYPNESFSKIVNAHGGKLNAFTADDFTAYFEEFSAKEIPLSFKMEADRMRHAKLTSKSFKKEIQVVMEERRIRLEDQSMAMTYERLRAAAFLSNPYHHMTIGWLGDLQHMTVQDVRNWYKEWYVPNNATIVVVGDVQPAKMLRLANRYFGHIPARLLPKEKPVVNQRPLGEKIINVALPEKLPIFIQAFRVPVIKTAKHKWQAYALDVLSAVLSGSDSSRFARNLVRGQQVAASVNTGYDAASRLDNIFTISGVPA